MADAEQDSLQVTLTLSADSGATFLFPVDLVQGDVGFPVFSGTDRQVIWHYDPDLIKLSANPNGFQQPSGTRWLRPGSSSSRFTM